MILILGAFLGLISVAFGAYAEHGLRGVVTEENFRFLMTAVRYNQVHSVVITVIGLTLVWERTPIDIPALRWSAILFIIGTMLFSFSIYLAVTFDIPNLLNVTPVGAVTIMLAWLLLLLAGILARKNL